MGCSGFDVRDYFFGELPEAERAEAERHVAACGGCSAELAELRGMRTQLLMLRDEEPPQRIGFVSDKIFEPSPLRRWASGFWLSGARLGFASAAMLSLSLLVFAVRQQPRMVEKRVEVVSAAGAPVDVNALVARAVSAAMAEQEKKTRTLLQASERKHEEREREMAILLSDYTLTVEKRMAANNKLVSMNLTGEGLRQ